MDQNIQNILKQQVQKIVKDTVQNIVKQFQENVKLKIENDIQKLVEKKEDEFKQRLELVKNSNPQITQTLTNLVRITKIDILKKCKLETIKIQEEAELPPFEKKEDVNNENESNTNIINNGGDIQSSQNINIRLTWNVDNDLDLHCICPCGTEIFYSNNKCNNCKTYLDRDMTGYHDRGYFGDLDDYEDLQGYEDRAGQQDMTGPLIEHMHLANAENGFKLKPGVYTYWVHYYSADPNTSYELSFQTNGQYYFLEKGSNTEITHIQSKKIQNQSESKQFKFTISEKIIVVPEQTKVENNTKLQEGIKNIQFKGSFSKLSQALKKK